MRPKGFRPGAPPCSGSVEPRGAQQAPRAGAGTGPDCQEVVRSIFKRLTTKELWSTSPAGADTPRPSVSVAEWVRRALPMGRNRVLNPWEPRKRNDLDTGFRRGDTRTKKRSPLS